MDEEGESRAGDELVENKKVIENKGISDVGIQGQREEEELHNTPFTPESCINPLHRQRNRATRSFLSVAPVATDATGNCESCPAAGYWDSGQYAGQGLLCFHYAYFMGKTGKPNPCSEMSAKCPRKENKNDQCHEFQSV